MRFRLVVFVAAPGCCVQPPPRIPGPAGPNGSPRPVEVLPVPALPCAKAIAGEIRVATKIATISDRVTIAFSLSDMRPNRGKADLFHASAGLSGVSIHLGLRFAACTFGISIVPAVQR